MNDHWRISILSLCKRMEKHIQYLEDDGHIYPLKKLVVGKKYLQ